jgi:hypothetical protein
MGNPQLARSKIKVRVLSVLPMFAQMTAKSAHYLSILNYLRVKSKYRSQKEPISSWRSRVGMMRWRSLISWPPLHSEAPILTHIRTRNKTTNPATELAPINAANL